MAGGSATLLPSRHANPGPASVSTSGALAPRRRANAAGRSTRRQEYGTSGVRHLGPSSDTIEDVGTIAAIGPLGQPPSSKYDRLIVRARQAPPVTTIVVHPCDESSLRGPLEA